jgi:hypothetical protein
MSNGNVTTINPLTTNTCTSGSEGTTIFVRSFNDQLHYKIMIWGLTGLPRMSDKW